MPPLRIAFASDHAGFALKKTLMEALRQEGHAVEDFGCPSEAAADLSDFAAPTAEALGLGRFDRAIFVDGAGYPSGIVANMFHGVFAAVCNDPVSAKLAREHGGANALCLGAMIVGQAMAREIVKVFLSAEPLPGKYEERRKKVAEIGARRRVGPLQRTRQVLTLEDLKDAVENKRPLMIDENTVMTPGVLDAVKR
ncbi:RpiB/LacA/LacB family sugar-phosphate isomerase [Candidatus Sumerlaeota bacterium]|nr:RpiB/LacA/LacB family sugar-phosphate isomerase [Candidatus Sumerlaeota bacterium]